MKRLTITGLAIYCLTWAAIGAAYFLAWLTDFTDKDNA